jgi:hypothetical protein
MFVESKSRIVYVLTETGMEPRTCSGGGLFASDGTLFRDGKQYRFVSRGIVKNIDVCKARLIYLEVMSGKEPRLVPLAQPVIRTVARREYQECELIFHINGKIRCEEWVDSLGLEMMKVEMHNLSKIKVQDYEE